MANNPFEYDAATNLDPKRLLDWYIEDYNYSRFINTSKNVIVDGERGSGKSMTLIYHSLKYVRQRSDGDLFSALGGHVGIYVPCNTPLSSKEEYKLLPEADQIRVSEANLILSIVSNMAREFSTCSDLFDNLEREDLLSEFSFILESDIHPPTGSCPFQFITKEVHRQVRKIQRDLNAGLWESSTYSNSFSTLVLPIIQAIRMTRSFRDVHISLLIDDVQDLNKYQQRLVNSWLAFRDHSAFSIKMAVVGLRNYDFGTAHGGAIFETHDYVAVNLQRPVQNKESEFGQFARDVIRRRLLNAGISTPPEEFFPVSETFVSRLEVAKAKAEAEAVERGMKPGSKPFSDFVYKQYRAYYFRDRHSKANKPLYTGLNTITHLSTGIIRNLLQPCYFMYEQQTAKLRGIQPKKIEPDIQDEVVKSESDKLWEFIARNLERRLSNCSDEDGKRIHRLFLRLAEYFRERLMRHASEPRVVTFIVSEQDDHYWPDVERLLDLAERAQVMYVRSGTSKKGGGREYYYSPNRMLWPRYGLDAVGQHGRASLRARDLWEAAYNNIAIELSGEEPSISQGNLFE